MKRIFASVLLLAMLVSVSLMGTGCSDESFESFYNYLNETQDNEVTSESEETNSSVQEENTTEKSKKDELKQYQAIIALENYGEAMYPYGFKVHTMGKIKAEQADDGSWDLEYKVTITNQYGTKYDAIASAYINNTTQRVENFKVRQQ